MASERNETLYIGVTNDLVRRAYEHKSDIVEGLTKTYGVHALVYYEVAETAAAAIHREKRLKKYTRRWKCDLIEKHNPTWRDLYDEIIS